MFLYPQKSAGTSLNISSSTSISSNASHLAIIATNSLLVMLLCGAKRRIISKEARELAILGGNEWIDDISYAPNSPIILNYLKYANHLGIYPEQIRVTLPPRTEEQIRKVKELCNNYNIIDDTSDLLIPDWTVIPSLDDDTDILIELLDINESDYLDDNGDLDTDSLYDHVKNLIADIMDFWSDSIRHFFRKINEKYGTDYPDGGNSHYTLKQELKKYFF